jgi:hypothetical protein
VSKKDPPKCSVTQKVIPSPASLGGKDLQGTNTLAYFCQGVDGKKCFIELTLGPSHNFCLQPSKTGANTKNLFPATMDTWL